MPGNRHSAWAGKLFVLPFLFKHPREAVKRSRSHRRESHRPRITQAANHTGDSRTGDSEHVAPLTRHVPEGLLQLG